MKIIQGHVHHVHPGGMEVLFRNTVSLLRDVGHEVLTLERSNTEIRGLAAKARAFREGIYSEDAREQMTELLRRERPDLVHLHNVYPLLSPSILDACAEAGVPVILACQDYTLTCPTRQHFREGAPCHLCLGGKEIHCVRTNCRGSLPLSVGYALRTATARRSRIFHRGVSRFAACSSFVRNRLIEGGYPGERIDVLPNMGDMPSVAPRRADPLYVAYLGRVSREKGVGTLLEAAALCPDIPVRIAGDGPDLDDLRRAAPANVSFVGKLDRALLGEFLAGAACLAVPSRFEEPFGIVAAEASGHGVPVVASRIGGLPEVVVDGATGLLHEPGDVGGLAECLGRLWKDRELREAMGAAGRERALREFSHESYRERLLAIYAAALDGGRTARPLSASETVA